MILEALGFRASRMPEAPELDRLIDPAIIGQAQYGLKVSSS